MGMTNSSAYMNNTCPKCGAAPGETCTWTGTPNERFPQPVGTPREMHAGRKFRLANADEMG